ncbi:PIN domain-containing protein [Trichothermofontia sp.]
MPSLPSIALLFDTTALLAGKTREWQDYAKLGTCYLPQVVLDEMEFLCDRAVEPAQELTAREFRRFYRHSGWQVTTATASHPQLQGSSSGRKLSKTARLLLATAEAAYGLSQTLPEHLVVVVSNDQNLRRRIDHLKVSNLCAIPVANLLQWGRSHQRPVNVVQKLQGMLQTEAVQAGMLNPGTPKTPFPDPESQGQFLSGRHRRVRSAATQSRRSSRKLTAVPVVNPTPIKKCLIPPQASVLSQVLSFSTALTSTVVALVLIWALLQPRSFHRTWRQLGLPSLPGQPANP